MANFTIERTIDAPPETVWQVLTDHRGYAKITPLRKAVLEKEGTTVPDGVGAIRRLSLIGPPMREEVLEYETPKRFVYKLLSGLPTKDHVGTVTLDGDRESTHLTYEVETSPTLGPLSPVFLAAMKQAISNLTKSVGKEAEKRGPLK